MTRPTEKPGPSSSSGGRGAVELQIGNNRPDMDAAEGRLLALMEANAFGDAARFAVRLAFEEAVINAFRHGHKGMPPETTVTIAIAVDPEQVRISVTDQGPGFDPDAVPDCTLDENLEKTSGRGLMLIRSFMSDVRHEMGGRRLVMTYRKDAAADGEAAA